MFEAGKSYAFHVQDEQGWSQSTLKVVDVQDNLLKVRRHGVPEFILNTASSGFHRAEATDHDADQAPEPLIIQFSSSDEDEAAGANSIKLWD